MNRKTDDTMARYHALVAGSEPEECDVDVLDDAGRTFLMHATIDRHHGLVRRLLLSGIDANRRDSQGWAALHFAAQNSDTEAIAQLIDSGALVDLTDNHGNSPLSRAVFSSAGNFDAIRMLLSAGADPDRANNYGQTPRGLAQTISNYDIKQVFAQK